MPRAPRPLLALTLLTGLNFLNYIDRYILFGVQPLIKQEFHPSDTELGALTTVFFIFYMCSAPGIGFLGDRKSRKLIITIGALVWSGATLMTAVTHSFRTLLTDLATMTRNTVRFGADLDTTVLATPTALQKHAFDLLGVSPTAEL